MTRLKLRRVAIDTYKENVAYLHRECALYRSEGFQALNKIEVHSEEGSLPVIAVLNVVVDKHCIGGIPGNRTTMLVVPIVVSRSTA